MSFKMFALLDRLFPVRNRRIDVVFVYNKNLSNSGSTIMRVHQLSKILNRYTNKELSIRCSDSVHNIKGSVIIINKNSIPEYSINQISEIRKSNKVLIDPIDALLDDDVAESVDGVIAASKQAKNYWSNRLKVPVFLVNHHADPRIKSTHHQRPFRCGYFGELGNTVISTRLKQVVRFVNVGAQTREKGWEKLISEYALHYSIRQYREFDGFKPFTKGFLAATCNSNIIVGSDDKEALSWLGHDYPYICKDKSIDGILETIKYAKDTYGKAEWREGLRIMNRVKDEVSPENIANQLFSAIKEVCDNE